VSESKSSEGRCPGAESATVATSKLTGYLLNPDPEVSGGKSAVFTGIGYTASNADQLRDVFISGLQGATATPGIPNGGGGINYVVPMTVTGPSGSVECQTIWAANPEGTHFVTAYPARKKGTTLLP
jgi:hypothetical protein